ncbi:hypothetical protein D3C85_1049310 [compost metagenome]
MQASFCDVAGHAPVVIKGAVECSAGHPHGLRQHVDVKQDVARKQPLFDVSGGGAPHCTAQGRKLWSFDAGFDACDAACDQQQGLDCSVQGRDRQVRGLVQ